MKGRLLLTGLLLFLLALIGSACFPEIERPTSTLPPVTVETVNVPITPGRAEANSQQGSSSCTDQNTGSAMSLPEALAIAQDSICITQGPLLGTGSCNENTGTWWVDLDVEQPGCLPACVIDVNDMTVEINWRCTGAVPPGATSIAGATSAPQDIVTELQTGNVQEVSYPGIKFSYSDLQAREITASTMPTTTFEPIAGAIIPSHDEFTFEEYALPDTFHRPVMYVYPVQEFSSGNEIAVARIGQLNQLLAEKPADPEGALPFLPLMSAGEMVRSRFEYLPFQNGEGIRYLTQLGQSYLPINNRHMIYTYQGLTDDGEFYVAVILPVAHPYLAADESDYPGGDPERFTNNYETYASDIEGQLEAAHESTFTPDLRLLDAMVESIEFTGDTSNSPPVEYDYSGWMPFTNENLGYSLYYPAYTTPLESPDGTSISFEGPLENNERWPVLTVSHFDSDFYRPPEGTDVETWVLENGIPFDELGPEIKVAGQPAFHLIVEPTPQSYGFDEFYFIRGERLFRILLLHTAGRRDWDLYNQFLGSFVFTGEALSEGGNVEAWPGTIGRYPPGFQSVYYFDTADGQQYFISGQDEDMNNAIEDAAWRGSSVEIWGELSETADLINISRLSEMLDFPEQVRDLIPFAEATASSELPADRQGSYQAWAVIDGMEESSWCEGATRTGVGEWIMLQFPGPVELTEIEVVNGHNDGEEEFLDRNRVKAARLVFSSGQIVWALDDGQRTQTRTFPAGAGSPGAETTFVRLIIDEVYHGLSYDDTCLGEIAVKGIVK